MYICLNNIVVYTCVEVCVQYAAFSGHGIDGDGHHATGPVAFTLYTQAGILHDYTLYYEV